MSIPYLSSVAEYLYAGEFYIEKAKENSDPEYAGKAVDCYNEALHLNPHNPKAESGYSDAAFWRDEFASREIEAARGLANSVAEMQNRLAIHKLVKVLKGDPNNAEAYYLLAVTLSKISDELVCDLSTRDYSGTRNFMCGDYSHEAHEAIQRAISLDPMNETYRELAREIEPKVASIFRSTDLIRGLDYYLRP